MALLRLPLFLVLVGLAAASDCPPSKPPPGTPCSSKLQCKRARKWWTKTLARKTKWGPGRYMRGFLHDSYFASCCGGAKKIAMVIPASESCPSKVHTRRSTKAFRALAIARKQAFCKPVEYKVCSYCIQVNVPPDRGVAIDAFKESVLVKPRPCKLWDFPNTQSEAPTTPAPTTPAPTTPAPTPAVLGGHGASCTQTCSGLCDPLIQKQENDKLTDESLKSLLANLGKTCENADDAGGDKAPSILDGVGCYRQPQGAEHDCDASMTDVERICWCLGDAPSTPAPAPTTPAPTPAVLGGNGASCTQTCSKLEKNCDPLMQKQENDQLTDESLMSLLANLGKTCDFADDQGGDKAPSILDAVCFRQPQGAEHDCDASMNDVARICWCLSDE